jgi:RNA polymerase sigma-70 factor (ECF subfamily)
LVDPEDVLVTDGERQIETNIFAGQVLKRALGLPEAQRETLLLVYVEGLTYQETASVLDVPIGTVMSRLAAARLKLSALQAPSGQNHDQEAR